MNNFEGVMPEEMNGAGLVLRKAKASGLVISRVPDKTRKEFIEFADEEFAGDYGLLLKHIWDEYKRNSFIETVFFQNIDMKLNELLNKDNVPKREEEKPKEIRFLSGRKVEQKKEVKNG